jgi:WD40 repeat protein
MQHHPCPTSSLASIAISPSGTQLAVWEGPLEVSVSNDVEGDRSNEQFKLFIMSLSGQLQGTFSPPSETGLGIRAVSWHPLGHYLAVGGWDDKVYILSSLTLDLLVVLEIPTKISAGVVSV